MTQTIGQSEESRSMKAIASLKMPLKMASLKAICPPTYILSVQLALFRENQSLVWTIDRSSGLLNSTDPVVLQA